MKVSFINKVFLLKGMVSEKEQEEIRKEAKRILDNFASALGKTKVKEKRLKRDVGGFREEKGKDERDKDLRERMFENAPKKQGDCIVAEKKKWQ